MPQPKLIEPDSDRSAPPVTGRGGCPHPVLHLIDTTLDTPYFRSIARCHNRERFPVRIGSIHPPGALQAGMERLGVPTFSLGVGSRRNYLVAVLRLARLLRRQGAILHAHCFDPTLVGLLAARIARVPYFFTRHHSDHNLRLNKPWHTRTDSWCARNADHVIAVSEATRDILTRVERVPDSRITVVYNGMEPLPGPTPEQLRAVRSQLSLNGAPICLMVARLHEEKGHRFLFEAAPEIRRQVPDIRFLLAGEGPDRAELERDVQSRGLTDCVQFLGRRNDMSALYEIATVVTLPSLAESFGFAVLEAMSQGKPVVAAATGGMPELVRDGEAGLIVPQSDSEALGEAILRILRSPEEARRMGEAGKARSQQFTFERMIRGYEAVYERVLSARGVIHA